MEFYFDEDTFDPQNLDHLLLLGAYLALTFYGFWLGFKMPSQNGKPSHRYNRETGKIERND